jgi:AcrR family transcriptional regulator
MNMTGRRAYRMTARAEAAAATGERVLDAMLALFDERSIDQITLEDVARRSGVTVQTVIRRFGGKDALVVALVERQLARVKSQRDQAPAGDVARAVEVLVDHYEEHGERAMRLLSEEKRDPAIARIADQGRALHAAWCARIFEPALGRLRGSERERRFAQLIAVCDVYMWKLLRRDRGLSRRQTELAIAELLRPLMED